MYLYSLVEFPTNTIEMIEIQKNDFKKVQFFTMAKSSTSGSSSQQWNVVQQVGVIYGFNRKSKVDREV